MTGATRGNPGGGSQGRGPVRPKEGAAQAKPSRHRMSLIDTTQLALESAMRGAWMRQTLLTNNVANADTPGYRREDVNFQDSLRTALANEESPAQVQFQPQVQPRSAGPGGNAVNIDQEAALLAENGLDYQAMVQVVGTRNNIVRSAMGVG
jgi:flagellar basal-body rod protein FlgB